MEIEKTREDDGYRIRVKTDKEVALVVRGDEERIYLPNSSGNSSGYYVEESSHLQETEKGFVAKYPGEIDALEVIS